MRSLRAASQKQTLRLRKLPRGSGKPSCVTLDPTDILSRWCWCGGLVFRSCASLVPLYTLLSEVVHPCVCCVAVANPMTAGGGRLMRRQRRGGGYHTLTKSCFCWAFIIPGVAFAYLSFLFFPFFSFFFPPYFSAGCYLVVLVGNCALYFLAVLRGHFIVGFVNQFSCGGQ